MGKKIDGISGQGKMIACLSGKWKIVQRTYPYIAVYLYLLHREHDSFTMAVRELHSLLCLMFQFCYESIEDSGSSQRDQEDVYRIWAKANDNNEAKPAFGPPFIRSTITAYECKISSQARMIIVHT